MMKKKYISKIGEKHLILDEKIFFKFERIKYERKSQANSNLHLCFTSSILYSLSYDIQHI